MEGKGLFSPSPGSGLDLVCHISHSGGHSLRNSPEFPNTMLTVTGYEKGGVHTESRTDARGRGSSRGQNRAYSSVIPRLQDERIIVQASSEATESRGVRRSDETPDGEQTGMSMLGFSLARW